MKLIRNKIKILIALLAIVLIYSFELAFVSEATGVEERLRKILHVVSFVSVFVVGFYYWKTTTTFWMKNMWLVLHTTLLLFLIFMIALSSITHIFSTVFLDQLYSLRLFFTSPVPFLISLLMARIPIFKK